MNFIFSGTTFDLPQTTVVENGTARTLTEFEDFGLQLAQWADGQFGYRRPPHGGLKHLSEEVKELEEAPYDRMEYADAFMLIVDCARRAGMAPRDLLHAAWTKLQINRNRKWGKPNAEGFCKHVEE